jgi:DNA replication initiation complex subunit (GINS family)|tara:strand:+ start:105 stop:230 length:126 start_codon:yes stop_codon:yes gene_type:complete
MNTQEKNDAQQIAEEFWAKVESEAAELEVTVDYYLEEFFFS